jgi:hypothetical protein
VLGNDFGKKYGTESNTFMNLCICVCHGKEQQKGKKKSTNFDAVSSDRMNKGQQHRK